MCRGPGARAPTSARDAAPGDSRVTSQNGTNHNPQTPPLRAGGGAAFRTPHLRERRDYHVTAGPRKGLSPPTRRMTLIVFTVFTLGTLCPKPSSPSAHFTVFTSRSCVAPLLAADSLIPAVGVRACRRPRSGPSVLPCVPSPPCCGHTVIAPQEQGGRRSPRKQM